MAQSLPSVLVGLWAGASRTLLKDAENYAEIEMEFSVGGTGERYAFTLQKVGKLTPHQLRRAAEAKLAEIRELAESLGDRSDEPAGPVSDRRLMEPLRRMLLEILDRP